MRYNDRVKKTLLLLSLAAIGCGGSGGSGGSIDPAAVWTYFGGAYRDNVRVGPAIVYLGNPDASLSWRENNVLAEDSGTWRKWRFSGAQSASLKFTPGPDYDTMEATLPDGLVLKCAADRTEPYQLPGF